MRLLVVLGVLVPSLALACMTLGAAGPVAISGEEALIVWDEASHTEHFIRRAAFREAPKDFGFLVPTPTKPELAEVPAVVFDRLYQLYESHVRARQLAIEVGPIAAMATPPVQVIEEKEVAGLDATVLKASDENALVAWLKTHKYPSTPALTAWLGPYVKAGAYVTAFKLSGDALPHETKAVRMSFHTDVPGFPYSEPPPTKPEAPRPFRVSILAHKRMSAKVGDAEWKAEVGFAAPLDEHSVRELLDGVVPESAQKAGFLTTFDEPASLRGAFDLTFSPARFSTRVAPRITKRIQP